MSYNIRIGIGMDQQTNLKRIAEVINKIQPDYVGLQEVDSVCERSGWINQYAELARLTGMYPILITGDFNMEPDSKEFKAMKQTWRLLSDPTLETYPSDHPRLRLDYIFGDLRHEFRIINDQVIDIQSSDHLPIYIDVLF